MRKSLFLTVLTVCTFLFVIKGNAVFAQSLPVGTPVLDDYYRRSQLIGNIDSNISYTLRPIISSKTIGVKNIFDPDSTLDKNNWISTGPIMFANGKGILQLLPFTWQQQINSDHPYGWNDGPMIPARGYQTLISGGFFIKYGPLSVQIRPEYVYANNTPFDGFASGHNSADLNSYNIFHYIVDWPERFGNNSYRRLFLGQSNISLTFGPVSMGISSENIWWGPGIKNSLIFTNNAAGFNHVSLKTIRPIKTYIGLFEMEVIAGHLNNSNYPALLNVISPNPPKRNEWRYLSAFNINYHPKVLPGLTLGLIRSFNAYYSDVKASGLSAYIPFFTAYSKQNINGGIGDTYPRDQITSLYARWLFKKARAELYFEYGFEDNLYNLIDLVQSPEHSRAYNFGMRKAIPINGHKDQYILLGTEITQTSQHTERSIRDVALWYTNYQLLQGHTNDGQTLGAGTGTGGNIQSVDISWVSGLKKIGIGFERYEHDVDFAEMIFPPINGNSRNWVDFALGLNGEWNYKNLLFNAKIQHIRSLNYEWILKDYDPSKYYIPHNNVYNLHAELGVTFRF